MMRRPRAIGATVRGCVLAAVADHGVMSKSVQPKFTVSQLISLAQDAASAIAAGKMRLEDGVCVSLEVCKDGDEMTYENRVHGYEPIQVCVVNADDASAYVHIQLIGEPNWAAYPSDDEPPDAHEQSKCLTESTCSTTIQPHENHNKRGLHNAHETSPRRDVETLYEDSAELAHELRRISKKLPANEAYFLDESAQQIECLYRDIVGMRAESQP